MDMDEKGPINPVGFGELVPLQREAASLTGDEEPREPLSLLSAIVEATTDGILAMDAKGRTFKYNRRMLDLWGILPSQVSLLDGHQLIRSMTDRLTNPDSFSARVNHSDQEAASQGTDLLEMKDGRVLERVWQPWIRDGKMAGWIWSFRDVTELNEAETTIRESDERYRRLFENITDVVFSIDREFRVVAVSPSVERQLGFRPEELVGKCISEVNIMDTNQLERALSDISRVFEGERLSSVEYEFISRAGTRIFGEVNADPVHHQGEIASLIAIARDVTDRKKAEKALRESQEMHRFLTDRVRDIIWIFDLDLKPLYISPSIFRVLGYTPEEGMKKPLSEMMTAESFARSRNLFLLEMKRDRSSDVDPARSITIELEYYRKDGSTVWLENVVGAVRDDEGRIISIQGASRDITERKHAEEGLRESEETFRSLFENMNEGVALHRMVYDEDGKVSDYRILDVNPAYEKHTGIPPERARGMLARQLYGVEAPPCLEIFETVARTGESRYFETDHPPLDGHFEISVFSPRRGWFTTIFSNISGRKKMEMNLQESFGRLGKALGATVQAMAVMVETRDPYTAGHQRRVADLARSMAMEMGLDADEIDGIHMAAAIHDIGKVSVPAEILSKPTKLKEIEFQLIKTHARAGYDIIKDIDFPWPLARTLLEHHERVNGSGYPYGLTGDRLLIGSRVLAVADVVEAIASHRPHRPSLGIETALEEISVQRGVLYDAEAVDACKRLFKEKGYILRS